MTKAAQQQITAVQDAAQALYASLELSSSSWKVAISDGTRTGRVVSVVGGDIEALLGQLEVARERFGLAKGCRVLVCQEAGRDGFWIHRALEKAGLESLVVDSSSIEVNRRARRAKTDRLDALRLLQMLMRHARGERVWSVLHVPAPEQEDARVLHRERQTLQKEIGREMNRIRSSLALFGIRVKTISEKLPVSALRAWDGTALPENKRAELTRELERLKLLKCQLRELDRVQNERLKGERECESMRKAAMLMQLVGIGRIGACILASEFFWRMFTNRREVGSAAGLTGVPYQSGTTGREQGISKAGSARIRALAVELAWLWLRYQPESALSKWFHRKWSVGTSRSRRVGIVALARRLLIDLWRYVEQGIVPDGAIMKRLAKTAA